MSMDKTPKIRVLVRKRPLSKKQQSKGQKDIIEIQNNQCVIVRQQKYKLDLTPYIDQYKFIFDGAFDQFTTNEQIYYNSIRPLVDSAFDGAKVSCFAYGQTGSGKTHTMLGDGHSVKGLYLLAANDIFQIIQQFPNMTVWISFYQIYCGKLYDLLNQRNILHAREDAKNNINIVGLSERKIINLDDIMNIIQFGTGIRVTAQNSTNVDSSRSHAILQINLKKGTKPFGKISFIDLAGSERASDHADQLQKQTRIDGAQINKSLLALKQCIRALDQNKNHTPFRGSKLTMVLKDSFVGYCKTVMIGNISPCSSSCQNTLNTLKYADRVKQLKKQSKNDMVQFDYLNDLSKQLMLPRTNHRHREYKHSESEDVNHVVQRPHRVMANNNNIGQFSQLNERKKSQQIIYRDNLNKKQKNSQKQQGQSNQDYQQSYNSKRRLSANQDVNRKFGLNMIPKQNNYFHNNSNFNGNQRNNYNKNNYLKDNEPQQKYSFQELQRKHQESIQRIIAEQEQLIKMHENHINLSIHSAKQQMMIMNQADKIGSSIDNYLNNLDGLLQTQLTSILQMRQKISNMRYHLDQSKKLQNLYLHVNRSELYQQMQDNLLEDAQGDQLLFDN